MSCLHLVLRGSTEALDTCLAAFGQGDTVVLMGSAVVLSLESGIRCLTDQSAEIYLHSVSAEAHGLGQLAGAASLPEVDDRQLVDLVCRHRHCLSWK